MRGDPWVCIDRSAFGHNLAAARRAAPGCRMLPVIKADAYGHGLERAAQALAAADGFAVARVSEGLRLREVERQKPILVLGGAYDGEELEAAAAAGLELVFHAPEQIELAARRPPSRPLRAWVKTDSGMHRLGLPPERTVAQYRRLAGLSCIHGRPGLLTHLACADDPDDPATERQLAVTGALNGELQAELSIANSAGVLGWPGTHRGWARPGIMLYGVSPFLGGRGPEQDLRPVMTLQSRITAIHEFQTGDAIGYGAVWRCPEPMRVAAAGIGYGDGYPRHAPAGTPVLINGRRAPLVGRVSMDSVSVDLRGRDDVRVGDPVTLWGAGLPAEEIAEAAGTIAYELFCGVTARVRFEETG